MINLNKNSLQTLINRWSCDGSGLWWFVKRRRLYKSSLTAFAGPKRTVGEINEYP